MQYDVFISYSSVDQKIAEGVCAYLEQHGIRCFVAYRDIPRGVVWAGAIVEALEHSRLMLVLFSKHFNDSRQVDREIELAAEQGMPILTFRLSNDDFTGAKKYYLKNLNWIDAFPNPERSFGSLKDYIVGLLEYKDSPPQSFTPPKYSKLLKRCSWLVLIVVVGFFVAFFFPKCDHRRIYEVNGVSFAMVRVDGGTFTMGTMDSSSYYFEHPAHQVKLSKFYIGETEVTQALWNAVMGNNPSYFKGNPQRPVENVSWLECLEFINRLNYLTGETFRFPTEAEWEYAARGGCKSCGYQYSGSNCLDSVGWYNDNSSQETHSVKEKSPNELGLYDMSGNVEEWCADWWSNRYPSFSQSNPQGPLSAEIGSHRVLRGGMWYNSAFGCRVGRRGSFPSDGQSFCSGLRLAL